MRLSEAIKLGAMLRPQCFGKMFFDDGSCANGAALEACGEVDGTNMYRLFPIVATRAPRCPACSEYDPRCRDICHLIAHLNDEHEWTRERIADFVESLEQAQASELPELVAVTSRDRCLDEATE